MEKEDFYQHLRVRDPYLQTPQNIPCQEKTNIGESICSDPSYANHVDDGYVTRYHDPVVAIKPLNSKSIVPQIKRPVKFEGQTNLYRTSARVYGSLVPRPDEVGPARRQDSAPNYRPNDTVGINRKFSRHLGELGQYRSYRNHSFSTTFDTTFYVPRADPIGNNVILHSFGYNKYLPQSSKYHTTGPKEYLYKKSTNLE